MESSQSPLEKLHIPVEFVETTAHAFDHICDLSHIALVALREGEGQTAHLCRIGGRSAHVIVNSARILDGAVHATHLQKSFEKVQENPWKAKPWLGFGIHITGVIYGACLALGTLYDTGAWTYSWLPIRSFSGRHTGLLRSSLSMGNRSFYTAHLALVAVRASTKLEQGSLRFDKNDHHNWLMLGAGLDCIGHLIEFGWLPLPFEGAEVVAHVIGITAHSMMLQHLWMKVTKEHKE